MVDEAPNPKAGAAVLVCAPNVDPKAVPTGLLAGWPNKPICWLGAGWPKVPVFVAPNAGVVVAPNAGVVLPKRPPCCWGAAAAKGLACPNRPPPAVDVWPNPKLLLAVVVVPNPAGLLPNRPVLPATDVAPKAEVAVLNGLAVGIPNAEVVAAPNKGLLGCPNIPPCCCWTCCWGWAPKSPVEGCEAPKSPPPPPPSGATPPAPGPFLFAA